MAYQGYVPDKPYCVYDLFVCVFLKIKILSISCIIKLSNYVRNSAAVFCMIYKSLSFGVYATSTKGRNLVA